MHEFNRYGGYAAPSDASPARSNAHLVPPTETQALAAETFQNVQAGAAGATSVIPVHVNRAQPEPPYQPHGVIPDPLDPAAAHSWPLHIVGLIRQLERLTGVLMTHQEQHDQYRSLLFTATASQSAGDALAFVGTGATEVGLRFLAKTLMVDNPSGYTLFFPDIGRSVPPLTLGFVVPCFPALDTLRVVVFGGTSAATQVEVLATERLLPPSPAGAGGGTSVSISGSLPAGTNVIGHVITDAGSVTQLAAGTAVIGHTITDAGSVVQLATGANVIGAVTQSGTWNMTVNVALPAGANTIGDVTTIGPANGAQGVVSVLTSSTTVKTATATRKRIILYNDDATNPVFVRLAASTAVTTDFKLKAGASLDTTYRGEIRAIATGGTVSVYYLEESY